MKTKNVLTQSLVKNRSEPKITNAIPIMTALVAGVLLLAVTSLVIAFTLSIQDGVDDSFTAGSLEANASLQGKEGVSNVADQLPNIGLVLAGAAVLLILVGAFAGLIALRR